MTDVDLYTVNVYKVPRDDTESDSQSSDQLLSDKNQHDPINKMSPVDKYLNMISAKVMNTNMVELEHSKLAGPAVKFKTVINYNDTLKGHSLGLVMVPQSSYIAP